MSRGFPSMTALLGLLALAGYQNRDKLGELLKGAGNTQPGASNEKGPLDGVLGNLSGGLAGTGIGGLLSGGLQELLERFKQNGQGDAAESWINKGPNKELPAPQLKQAIGPDVLAALEQQTGLSQEELLARLSRELPTAVDQYTPDGRLPHQTTKRRICTGHYMDNRHWLHSRRYREVYNAPGDNEPAGFVLTAILGIVGAFVATFLGQTLGWYRPGEGAGLIGAVVGAIIVLLVYGMVAGRRRVV